jgi:ribose transport system permease protein
MFGTKYKLPDETSIFLVLVVVVLVLSALSPTFGTVNNGLVLLLNGAVVGILALGQTFVLLTGGIDLSTAAVMAFSGVIATLVMSWGVPWPVACAAALACSLAIGVVNGLIVRYGRLPAFIATFGMQGIVSSLAQVIPNGVSITAADPSFSWLGQGYMFGVPVAVILFGLVAIAAAALLKWTRLGVHIYALGGNPRAARLAGVNTARTTIFVYATSAGLGGLGGLITASRLMVGFPYVSGGNELFYSIAGAVVGGVSLFGGVGSILGVAIGSVLIATLANGLDVLSISSFWQPFVIGLVILLGVGFDTYRRTARGGSPLGLSIAGLRLGRAPEASLGAAESTAPPAPPGASKEGH